GQAGGSSRRAERPRRHSGAGGGSGGARHDHGHVFSAEARPSPAAGPRPVRRGAARRYRYSRRGARPREAPHLCQSPTPLAPPAVGARGSPPPGPEGPKYARGLAVGVSGPAESTGAARLGARGALRMGAGLVTVVGNGAATAVNATQLTAVMVKALASDRGLS